MKKTKADVIAHRLAKSDETLRSARLLIGQEMWSSAINRLYYAVYHAVAALMM